MDIIYEALIRIHTNNTSHTNADIEETQIKQPEAEDRILDITTLTNLLTSVDLASTFSTLTGIFNFITRNMDVITAIALVRHLENRAMYDPRQVNKFLAIMLPVMLVMNVSDSERASQTSWRTVAGSCKTFLLTYLSLS